MHYAACCGNGEGVRLLRERGGDGDRPDHDGQTARGLMPEAFAE